MPYRQDFQIDFMPIDVIKLFDCQNRNALQGEIVFFGSNLCYLFNKNLT